MSTSPDFQLDSADRAHIIRVAFISDIHSRDLSVDELPAADLGIFFCGDASYQPVTAALSGPNKVSEMERRVQRQIKDFKHVRSWPYETIFAVGGNHDWLAQEAFGSNIASEAVVGPRGGRSVRSGRPVLSGKQKKRIKNVCQTDEEARWYFGEHGVVNTKIKGHPISAFLSSFSQHRGKADGWTFEEEAAARKNFWKPLSDQRVDFCITHGPPADYLTRREDGEQALDRDGIVPGDIGSESLAKAIYKSKPGIAAWGHVHNAHGSHPLNYSDGGVGMAINAAVVLSGDTALPKPLRLEYNTPRAPYVVDYNVLTGESVLVSPGQHPTLGTHASYTVTGQPVTLPEYAKPIFRQYGTQNWDPDTETELQADRRMLEATLGYNIEAREVPRWEDVSAFRDSVLEDYETGRSGPHTAAVLSGITAY